MIARSGTAVLLALAALSAASAGDHAPLDLPSDKPVLIVVHPAYEPEADIDGKAKGWPVVYILDCERGKNYVSAKPTAGVCSRNGMHSIRVRSAAVFLAGGQYNGCLNRASKAIAAAAGFPILFSKHDMSLVDEDRKVLLSMAARSSAGAPARLTLHYIRDALYSRPMPDFSHSLKTVPAQNLLDYDPEGGMVLGAGFNANLPPVWKTLDADVEYAPEEGASVALAKAGKPGPRTLVIRFVTLGALRAARAPPAAGLAGMRVNAAPPTRRVRPSRRRAPRRPGCEASPDMSKAEIVIAGAVWRRARIPCPPVTPSAAAAPGEKRSVI